MTSAESEQAYQRAYRQAHKEERRASQRAWRLAHLEETRDYNRRYRQEHRAEILAHGRSYAQAYRQTERGRALHRRNQARRRALQVQLPATFTEAEWQYAVGHFENRCAYCGAGDVPLQQEHVVALTAGGGWVAQNIVPACKRCNVSKNAASVADWIAGRGAAFVMAGAVARIGAYLQSVEAA